jgi:DnaJ-class molecular chaperone
LKAMRKNYYTLFKLPRDASHDTIRRTYRKEIRKVHPDVTADPDLERLLEIQQAYETLADPEKREAYDRSLESSESKTPPSPCVSEAPHRSPRAHPWLEVILTPQEAAHGVTLSLDVPIRRLCPYCRGHGEGFPFLCRACRGAGQVVVSRVVRFQIPAGTRDGEQFRLWVDSIQEELPVVVAVLG